MKALKDLGVYHERLEGYLTITEPLIWMTPDERREFARMVWEAAANYVRTYGTHGKLGPYITISERTVDNGFDEFIKREGL